MSESFRLPEKTDVFEFDEGDYQGAEIVLRLSPVPLAVFMDISKQIDANDFAHLEQVATLYQSFADAALVSWNLVDRNEQPIPATGAGMLQLDLGMGISLMVSWVGAVSRVSAPLGLRSRSGTTSRATPTSRSRRNSRKPKTS